jgi:hypothetical protein
VWVAQLASAPQEKELVGRMKEAVAGEYRALIADVAQARALTPGQRSRSLARHRRELHRIRARDYFGLPDRELAQRAIDDLASDEVLA